MAHGTAKENKAKEHYSQVTGGGMTKAFPELASCFT